MKTLTKIKAQLPKPKPTYISYSVRLTKANVDKIKKLSSKYNCSQAKFLDSIISAVR